MIWRPLTDSITAPSRFTINAGSRDINLEERTIPKLDMNEPTMVDASQLGGFQQTSPSARDLMSRFGSNVCCGPEQPLPATAEAIVTQSHRTEATLPPPQVTRPKRHAAVKALHTLSVAYQPLIIHAAHGERRSSLAYADGDAEDPHDEFDGSSALLVIDDMLPPADGSEGESDAYEATIPRKRRQTRTGEKTRRRDGSIDHGSVRRPRGKRVEKLDRDDLRLIARAAQGLMSADEKKRSVKKKGKREEMLDALKRVEAEEFVRFVEESVDWKIAVARLSEVTVGPNKQEGTAEQAQFGATSQGLLHTDPRRAMLHVANCENVLTAESLKEHWRNVLSSRIVSMYLE